MKYALRTLLSLLLTATLCQSAELKPIPSQINGFGGEITITIGGITMRTPAGTPAQAFGSNFGFYEGPIVFGSLAPPAVSAASQANLYFDGTGLKLSVNGGAYAALGGGSSFDPASPTFGGDVMPSVASTYGIGSNSVRWTTLYLSGGVFSDYARIRDIQASGRFSFGDSATKGDIIPEGSDGTISFVLSNDHTIAAPIAALTLRLGPATADGIRLKQASGVLTVRNGDDSANATIANALNTITGGFEAPNGVVGGVEGQIYVSPSGSRIFVKSAGSGSNSSGWILLGGLDTGWAANASAGNKSTFVADYTAVDFSAIDATGIGLNSLSAQVQALTRKLQALEAVLAAQKFPDN